MEIDPDPEKQRCEGILAATGAAGADVGAKVRQELFWGCLCQIDVEIYVCAMPGDEHDQPANRADALQICHRRGTHNWHGEYQGRQNDLDA